MSRSLHAKWEQLQAILSTHRRVLVAFSGGCDSTFLLAAARRTLGKADVLAVTAVSASLPERERQTTVALSGRLDVHHQFLETQELNDPAYAANPSNRCFFCKNELFSRLMPLARAEQMALADGFNVSDRSDYRPGFQASKNWGVSHPLDDAELTKQEIRTLSRWLKLPTWKKPASPCLSSRIPYGTRVTRDTLAQIEQAEEILHAEGFSIVRVRHYGQTARVEVPLLDLPRLKHAETWPSIVDKLKQCGYADVVAEPRGFQSGRLNEALHAAP